MLRNASTSVEREIIEPSSPGSVASHTKCAGGAQANLHRGKGWPRNALSRTEY